jgi:hypothetical protein
MQEFNHSDTVTVLPGNVAVTILGELAPFMELVFLFG